MKGMTSVLANQLREITIRQASLVAARTHQPVTEDDLARWMPHARAIHDAALTEAPDPRDASIPMDFHEWASRMIALNLVARSRGFDVARLHGAPGAARPAWREVELRPVREVTEVP